MATNRWQDWMKATTRLAAVRVDTLFLDTTYCMPRYTFPSQDDAVAAMVQVRCCARFLFFIMT